MQKLARTLLYSDDLYPMFSCTISKQLNENNEKQALFEESFLISSLSTPHFRTSYHASTDWVL